MKYINGKSDGTDGKHCIPIHGIWGVGLLFVEASIGYTTYLTVLGTEGLAPKVLVVPQIAFAIYIAIYKFSRS